MGPYVGLGPYLGLQSIPRDSNDKDMAAMLLDLTIEANEESFVIVLQHGSNDVTICRQSQNYLPQFFCVQLM